MIELLEQLIKDNDKEEFDDLFKSVSNEEARARLNKILPKIAYEELDSMIGTLNWNLSYHFREAIRRHVREDMIGFLMDEIAYHFDASMRDAVFSTDWIKSLSVLIEKMVMKKYMEFVNSVGDGLKEIRDKLKVEAEKRDD
jgi:hypothetical protein